MSVFIWTPSLGAKESVTPSVLKSKFGDGYEQRVANGINTMPRIWSVSFSGSREEIEEIVDFLRAKAGVESFDWQPPKGLSGKFVCDGPFDTVCADKNTHTHSTVFREVFEP